MAPKNPGRESKRSPGAEPAAETSSSKSLPADLADERGLTLLQGTLDVLILQTLAEGSDHGYAISRRIRERTAGDLSVDDAALYQALHRMQAKGWIGGEWGVSDRGRRARFYRLTADGERRLSTERASWDRYVHAVARVLGGA